MGVQRAAGRIHASTGTLALLLPVIAVPFVLFWVLRAFPDMDPMLHSASFHLGVVGTIAACTFVVAGFAAVAALAVRRHQAAFLALGCLAVGGLMLAHGLLTPGMLGQPMNMWVSRLPNIAIASFAIALAASLLRHDHPIARFVTARVHETIAAGTAAVVVIAAGLVLMPHSLHGSMPLADESTYVDVLGWATAALLVATTVAYFQRWRLGRDAVQFALTLASALCVSAVFSLQFGRLWHLSWWDYHAYLLLGFSATVYAIAHEYRRTRTVSETMRPVVTRDAFEQIAARYTESLKPLVAAVEAKDAYTHGHSARAAEFATRLGIRLRLDPGTLRSAAEGAYLHDIGKIAVPDAILNKAGPLTPEEREVIEQHPVAGYEIAQQAASLSHALPVIKSHHERWDGKGYPDGLRGQEIPLIARVASVADVWDALTSDRAYRRAWTEQEALAHLLAGRGAHFDPTIVEALESMLYDAGVRPLARGGESTIVHHATEVCHHATEAHG